MTLITQLQTYQIMNKFDEFCRAFSNATDYPIGSHCWDIHSPLFNGAVNLNLNACDDEEEYNCADGTCVIIEDRCNGKNDCPDGSDEQAKPSLMKLFVYCAS